MKAPINPFKKALAEGRTLFGCWMGIPDTFSAELVGHAGFDWVVIDAEHGPNDQRATFQQLQVLAGTDAHAIVRLPVGETWMIKKTLDAGAQTILVPMVESADEARRLARAVSYPPKGTRGVAHPVTRAARFSQITAYGHSADDQICLLIQVENRAGLDALDEILTVEDIDGVFIGPADLAADLGHMDDIDHPDVQAAIMDALSRIAAAGKAPGFLSMDDAMIHRAMDAGARFLAVGSDVAILAQATRSLAAKWQATKA